MNAVHASPTHPPMQWHFARVKMGSSRQLLGLFAGFALVLQIIGIGFSSFGADLILGFTSLELVALGIILAVHLSHARDHESIQLSPSQVLVEVSDGQQARRHTFERSWVQTHLTSEHPPLLRIHQGREGVSIGRFVPAHQRFVLFREIRASLQGNLHV